MKKSFLLVLFLIIIQSTFCYSQKYQFAKDSFGNSGTSSNVIALSAKFKNLVNDTLDLRWVKIFKDLPSGWDATICDLYNCYPATVDSVNFTVQPGDSGYFTVDFDPKNIEGNGKIRLFVFEPTEDRNLGITATFYGTTTTGINDQTDLTMVSVFPVPANEYLNINTSKTGNYQVEILDITGKIIKRNKFIGVSSLNLLISDINPGYYISRLTLENGKQITTGFTKN